MKISVVIASYNRREELTDCLKTLLDQDFPGGQFEIVVVIDGSTDGTGELLRSFVAPETLIVVSQPNRGQTAALNAGVKASTGDVILFLDDDLLCDPGLLAAHGAAQRNDEPTLVFGQMKAVLSAMPNFAETWTHENLEAYYARLNADPQSKWPDDAWAGPNCSLPRDAFLAIGGYDEQMFPRRGEDVDLGVRLWKAGLRFRYAPNAVTWHELQKPDRQLWNDAIEDGASSVRLCHKHPEMRRYSALVGATTGPAWKRLAESAAARWPSLAALVPGWLARIFGGIGSWQWAHRTGMRLFHARQKIATVAGASREAGSWSNLVGTFGRRLAVLLYHHIGHPVRGTESLSLTVTPAKFRRQVRWLRWRGYTRITSAQWLAWIERGDPLPGKPLLLTFDDAYEDITKHAFPVLERYGSLRSIVFAISGKTGEAHAWDGLPQMTMGQLRYWAGRGVEVGAHTRTHPDLTSVSDKIMNDEVTGSGSDLLDAGLTPASFAYPYGCFDERVRGFVAGVFKLAFTCEEGLNDLRTDPLLLRRTMVQPGDTILDIELRAALGRSPLNTLRSRLRLGSRLRRVLRSMRLLPG